jgi:hypothetical protein
MFAAIVPVVAEHGTLSPFLLYEILLDADPREAWMARFRDWRPRARSA